MNERELTVHGMGGIKLGPRIFQGILIASLVFIITETANLRRKLNRERFAIYIRRIDW